MRNEKSNVPAVKSKSEVLREVIERGTGGVPKKGGYYEPAPGKFEPDAWRVQEEANEAKVSTKIVKAEQNDRYSEVIAEATTTDGTVVQGIVHHDFDTIMAKKIMEMFKKTLSGKQVFWGERGARRKIEPFNDPENPFRMSETGKMIPNLSSLGMAKIMDDMLRFRDFSLRDATSKAMRIAQQKALNREWREEEEIKAEEEEVKYVNKGKVVKKVRQKDVDKRNLKAKQDDVDSAVDEQELGDEEEGEIKEEESKNNESEVSDAGEEEEGTEEKEASNEEVQEEEGETEDSNEEGEKTPTTELLDDTDELTKAELHEMTAEEIGKWAVKKLRKEEKDITGAEIGKILMVYNRKRWLSTRKLNKIKEWFIDEWMTG